MNTEFENMRKSKDASIKTLVDLQTKQNLELARLRRLVEVRDRNIRYLTADHEAETEAAASAARKRMAEQEIESGLYTTSLDKRISELDSQVESLVGELDYWSKNGETQRIKDLHLRIIHKDKRINEMEGHNKNQRETLLARDKSITALKKGSRDEQLNTDLNFAALQAEVDRLTGNEALHQVVNAAALEVELYGATVSRLTKLREALNKAEQEFN